MIAEDVLERGFAAAADDYAVPAGAADRIREQLAPQAETAGRRLHLARPSTRGWLAIAAAAAVVVLVLSFVLGGTTSRLDRSKISAGAPEPVASSAVGSEPLSGGGTGDAAGGSAAGTSGSSSDKSAHTNGQFQATAPAAGGTTTDSNAVQAQVDPVATVPDRVIKTGVLDLQVPKGQVGGTLDHVQGIATIEGGYVQNSRTSEGGVAPSGSMTLRVPVAKFEDTVKRARELGHVNGAKVLGLETSGQDVTGKYVDLKARIRALQAERKTFLTILGRATTIGETLMVQQRVTDVQSDIERLQGQLKVLANSSAMSTLTVTVDQKTTETVVKHHEKSGIAKAFDRSVDRFVRGVEAIVAGIGPVLLALLIIGFAWLIARVGYRVLRRRLV